jgi:hypothetical protein
MEQIFVSSIIKQDTLNNQYNMSIQYLTQKKEYKRQKLIISKIRTGTIKPPNKLTN